MQGNYIQNTNEAKQREETGSRDENLQMTPHWKKMSPVPGLRTGETWMLCVICEGWAQTSLFMAVIRMMILTSEEMVVSGFV